MAAAVEPVDETSTRLGLRSSTLMVVFDESNLYVVFWRERSSSSLLLLSLRGRRLKESCFRGVHRTTHDGRETGICGKTSGESKWRIEVISLECSRLLGRLQKCLDLGIFGGSKE